MRPKTPGRPGVVIEFKVKRENQSADVALEDAAQQVREKRYAVALTAAGISPVYEYAMAFDGKQAYVALVDDVPLGVDTPHDLERARAILAARRKGH
jgi:hypothetical protein